MLTNQFKNLTWKSFSKFQSDHHHRTISFVTWKNNVATSSFPPIPEDTVKQSFTDFVLTKGSFLQQPDDKLAVVESQFTRTFGDLKRDVQVFRTFVEKELKLKKGDMVTLISPNHADYFSTVHGFCSAGVVVSPVNPVYTPHEIEFQLKRSQSKAIVTHISCLEAAEKAAKDVGLKNIIIIEEDDGDASKYSSYISLSRVRKEGMKLKLSNNNPAKPIVASGEDLAVLPFSSGTTGLPKGTMLSHGNLCANLAQFQYSETCFFKPDDVVVSPLPMFHIYSFTVSLNLAIMHGKTLVTCKRFDMDKFCEQVQKYKCSRGHVVPPVILGLAKSPIVTKYDMSSLKVLISAAAPLGPELEKEVMKRFPGLLCKQAWGMSELSPVGTCTRDDAPKSGSGTVGPPVMSTEVKVVDVKSRQALPPNSEGELLVRGPQVMKGYFNEPQKTKECLDNEGWLATGDIAKIDEDGYVYITDRLKELIKFKGFQVAPAELEAVLLTHPAILDAVVISRPDKEAEEVPRAYCVLKPNQKATAEDVMSFVSQEVAHYKRLRGGVIFTDKIPKTASGKILRREVVAMDRKTYPIA
jgi:4-coumarate--CoA ligase